MPLLEVRNEEEVAVAAFRVAHTPVPTRVEALLQ